MNLALWFPIVAVFSALAFAGLQVYHVVAAAPGNPKMVAIARAISEGASAYLKRQYGIIAPIALGIAAILFIVLGEGAAISFLVGASLSAISGIAGMNIAVRANVKTAEAAKKGLSDALALAFRGGSAIGLVVAGLALAAVMLVLLYPEGIESLVPLGFGASLISIFARIGGGIYTKAADVGTDMVGKIEAGIPEDDPRNPGVIADNVGDNVGDCAGMAADLFETYVVTMVAAIILGRIALGENSAVFSIPLLIGGASIAAAIIASFFVKVGKDKSIMKALYKGLGVCVLISSVLFYFIFRATAVGVIYPWVNLYVASLVGILTAIAMVAITEFYTSKKFGAVRSIAEAAVSGHGTNVISGLSVSLSSTAAPAIVICLAIIVSYLAGELYGVAIAAVSMLSLTGIIVAIDAFGPITDNAGGIGQMANLPAKARKVTDALDAVGNTTKAVTKGYAIASAGVSALVLFAAYADEIGAGDIPIFSLSDPAVIVGLFVGSAMTFLFASLLMGAVSKTAISIVGEIRRQFKEIPGLMKGTARPEYGRAVDIVTIAALKEMLAPALLPVVVPFAIAIILGPIALGGFLVGTIVVGLFLAISMTTGGAAWDNAKKYIEEGNLGGKGSPAHQAAVTGDIVGDPYKDTAGPAINPMIKVANIVALLLAPFLV